MTRARVAACPGRAGDRARAAGCRSCANPSRAPGSRTPRSPGRRRCRNPTVYACTTLIARTSASCGCAWSNRRRRASGTRRPAPRFRRCCASRTATRLINEVRRTLDGLEAQWGNTYVLKQRDERGVVVALYVLDPTKVTLLVAPDGAVYYQLQPSDAGRRAAGRGGGAGARNHPRPAGAAVPSAGRRHADLCVRRWPRRRG